MTSSQRNDLRNGKTGEKDLSQKIKDCHTLWKEPNQMQGSYSSLVETSRVSSSGEDLSRELNNGSAAAFVLRELWEGVKSTQLLPQHRAWRKWAGRRLLVLLLPYHTQLHLQRLLLSNPCTVDSSCASGSLPLRKWDSRAIPVEGRARDVQIPSLLPGWKWGGVFTNWGRDVWKECSIPVTSLVWASGRCA